MREQEIKLKYKWIGDKDDLVIVRVGYASFKTDDKAIGGVVLFLANSSMTRAAPIFWKTKQIEQVCHRSQNAETLNLLKMMVTLFLQLDN